MKWKLVIIQFILISYASGQTENADFDATNFDEDGVVEVEEESPKEVDHGEGSSEQIIDIGEYFSPVFDLEQFFFAEHFDNMDQFLKNWIKSFAKKDDIDDAIAKYDGLWELELPKRQLWKNDLGLVLKSKAKHAAISSKLHRPFVFKDKPLVVQYEVTLQDGQECGGSYLKLLSQAKETEDLTKFNDKTPYTIMFGPDKCGNDVKLHFIFRHVNPINGTITEKHCRKPKERLEEPFKDKLPHLYRLVVKPDNTYEISVDHKVVIDGSLLTDFTPPVNPPKEIDDPVDQKPEDWDEREKIPDPDAVKPEDWDEDAPPKIPDPSAVKPEGWLDDEPEMISDPTAVKPDDWDVSIDGEWEAPLIENPACEKAVGCGEWSSPLINNPEYKGKWRAPLIENPNYQGKWSPRKIQNPDFYEDLHPFKMTPIVAVGIELWSMSSDILFDNILITDDVKVADEIAAKTFDLKRKHLDYTSNSLVDRFINYSNDHPWLWAVYILVLGTPLSFAVYTLCSSYFTKPQEEDMAARAKKTDEPSPDDEEIKNEEENIEEINEQENDNIITSPKSKKSDLEVNNQNGDNNDSNENNTNENEEKEDDNDNDTEENDIEEDEEGKKGQVESIGDVNKQSPEGTRKRKPRKE